MGPVAGAAVVVGVALLASVVLVVSLFSLSYLSLSNFSLFSSATALAATLATVGFTGSLETGGLAVVGKVFYKLAAPNLVDALAGRGSFFLSS